VILLSPNTLLSQGRVDVALDGKDAVTDYQVLETVRSLKFGHVTRLRVVPHTGAALREKEREATGRWVGGGGGREGGREGGMEGGREGGREGVREGE